MGSIVNLTIGVVALVLGVAMVWVAMPKGGVSPAFMRTGLMELFYPISCLIVLIVERDRHPLRPALVFLLTDGPAVDQRY
jgi:hypothetical protein